MGRPRVSPNLLGLLSEKMGFESGAHAVDIWLKQMICGLSRHSPTSQNGHTPRHFAFSGSRVQFFQFSPFSGIFLFYFIYSKFLCFAQTLIEIFMLSIISFLLVAWKLQINNNLGRFFVLFFIFSKCVVGVRQNSCIRFSWMTILFFGFRISCF